MLNFCHIFKIDLVVLSVLKFWITSSVWVYLEGMQFVSGKVEILSHNSFSVNLWTFQLTLVFHLVENFMWPCYKNQSALRFFSPIIMWTWQQKICDYHWVLQSAVLWGPGGAYRLSLCSAALLEKKISTALRIDHLQSVWILLLAEAAESPKFTIKLFRLKQGFIFTLIYQPVKRN